MPKKSKAKAPKSAAKKSSPAKSTAKALGGAAVRSVPGGNLAMTAVGLIGSRKKGGGSGLKRKKSAKQRLKSAYEKRALRQLRMGNLGAAKKALRQKASVV